MIIYEPLRGTLIAPVDRQTLLADVLEELVSHTPAAMMRAMRRWPAGPVSLIHLQVLTILDADGPLPMGRLAEALDVSQASATGIVDRMAQRALIERTDDPDDRRVVRVALTEDGRRMIEGVSAVRKERLARVLEELTDDELEGFLRGSRALRAARDRFLAALPKPPEASGR